MWSGFFWSISATSFLESDLSDLCPNCGNKMELIWDAIGNESPYFKCNSCGKEYRAT